MRDYNYFTLIKRRKRQRSKSKINPDSFMKIFLVLGILAVITWPITTQVRLFYLDQQIDIHTQKLTQDPGYPLFQEVEQKQAELANSQAIVSSLQQVSNVIFEKEIINENLLQTITALLPSDTQLTSLTLSGQTVGMTGVARSRTAVAELLRNLRNSGKFGPLFINSLNENNGLYPFSLNLELIGGAIQ